MANLKFSKDQEEMIFAYLESVNSSLLFYIKMVKHELSSPLNILRIQIGDFNKENKTVLVKGKEKKVNKECWKLIKPLLKYNNNDFLVTHHGHPYRWLVNEKTKTEYFNRRFKLMKKKFKLKSGYTLKSFIDVEV